jgi:hypothetical protein
VLDRCHRDVVAHGIDEALKTLGTILADPGDGRGDQLHAEEIGHQRGKTLLGQQLVVQQIQHDRADPFAVLHWGAHPRGERRPCLRAAGRATAAVRAMLGDDQRLRCRKIEHLPGGVAGRHHRGQRFTTRGADLRIMIDGGIRLFNAAKCLARMALLTAGLLA